MKKIGTDMMEEPAFKPILMQPLKMQGVVDIKDNSVIVRFKFMARPKNPSAIQRMAVRRMYEQLPGARHPVRHADLPVRHAGAHAVSGSRGAAGASPPPAAAPAEPPPAPAKAAE